MSGRPPDAVWPPAGPDRRAVAGAPRLLRTVGDMTLVHHRGRYFAVPVRLGAVDAGMLASDEALPPGVLVADSESALEKEIEFVGRWANSRGQFDAQEAQRDISPFRAGSVVGEPETSLIADDDVLIRSNGEVYAVPAGELAKLAGARSKDVRVISAVSDGALMATLGPINDYFVFFLDHLFYAVPLVVLQAANRGGALQGLPLHEQPGTLMSESYPDLLQKIGWSRARRVARDAERSIDAASSAPRRVRSLHGYNIVAYEGWFYGLPERLGDVDLTEIDALSLPGVIADVAQVAVEQEIQDRFAKQTAAPAPPPLGAEQVRP